MYDVKKIGLLAILSLAGTVQAEDGFYTSISTGLSKVNRIKSAEMPILYQSPTYVRTPQFGNDGDTLKFKKGFNLLGAVGYQYQDARFELEASYHKAKYKGFFLEGSSIAGEQGLSGHTRLLSFLGNAYYDFPVQPHLTPYVGAGVGMACSNNHFKDKDYSEVTATGTIINAPIVANKKQSVFAYER